MITQDRNGNALPSTVDPGRLAWSARIAYTNGDYLTPSGWTYYELPPSAILQRSRSSVLDGTTWECRLTVLAEAVPELSDLQAYYQLEVDLVDDTGNAWPYHTGPIDSISDSYSEQAGAIVQTKEIASFGTLQRLKNARVNGFFWDGNSQAVSSGQVLTGYCEAQNFQGTKGAGAANITVTGAWNTVDATVTGGYYGIIISVNADFSAPMASPADYSVTATDGSELVINFTAASPTGTFYVKYWQVRYWGLRRRAITYAGAPADPTFVRVPDGTMPAGTSETSQRRRISDTNSTFAAAGCTTTVITVQDPEPYKNIYVSRLVAPTGTFHEVLCHTASDGTETFRQISSTDAAGVITLAAALPAAPAEGDPIRIVTTEIERELLPSSAGTLCTFYTSAALTAEHPRDAFFFDARAGILLPQRPLHWTSASEGVYVDNLRYVPSIKGTLGSTDSSIESFVYRTFTDFPATDTTKFFRSADFVQGNFSGCYVKGYSAANTTWDAVLREVTDLAAAPNVFVHDLTDGRLKVGAYYQKDTPDAELDLLTGVQVEAQPEPMTAVAVKSILSKPINIAGRCLQVQSVSGGGSWSNFRYLFDGDRTSYATHNTSVFSPLLSYGRAELRLPFFPMELFPFINSLVVYAGDDPGVFSVLVQRRTASGTTTSRYVQGMGFVVQAARQPASIPGQAIEEAMFQLGLDANSRYSVVVEGRYNNNGLPGTKDFTATEIELLVNADAIWVARLNDQTSGAPAGWTTTNQQGFGSIWWQASISTPVSNRYVPTSYLKRVIPSYDSAGTYRFDRLQLVEMEQATATECRRYAETFMDEYLRLGRTYSVQAVLDPRVDLGDTVVIALDDGQTLDLFVWGIEDGGGPDDLTATYKLIDYSA